jgi:hypothetical protein
LETSGIDKSKVYYFLKKFPKLKNLQMMKKNHDRELLMSRNYYDEEDEEKHFEDSGHSNLWGLNPYRDVFPDLVNTNIKVLKLQGFSHFANDKHDPSFGSLEILEALPTLKTLYVDELTLRLMGFIARNLQVLKKERYETDEYRVLKCYEDMKQEVEGINTNIEFFKVL